MPAVRPACPMPRASSLVFPPAGSSRTFSTRGARKERYSVVSSDCRFLSATPCSMQAETILDREKALVRCQLQRYRACGGTNKPTPSRAQHSRSGGVRESFEIVGAAQGEHSRDSRLVRDCRPVREGASEVQDVYGDCIDWGGIREGHTLVNGSQACQWIVYSSMGRTCLWDIWKEICRLLGLHGDH